MIRIHFTADDFTRVRFAPRPSPVPEMHAALMMLGVPDEGLMFGRWRRGVLRSLPAAVGPLADLVPDGVPPAFLDVLGDTPDEGFALIRSQRPEFVRSGLREVYGARPVPPWIRGLYDGDDQAWRTFGRAHRAAYESVLAPVWNLVQDLHRAEFTRHALILAEQGLGAALAAVVPGSLLRDGIWELPPAGAGATGVRDVRLDGRGLVLLPTFHWRRGPLVQDLPGLPERPVSLAFPAGRGLPLLPDGGAQGTADEPLAGVLGRTRLALLRSLDQAHTTTGLARRIGVSNATASAHAAALRAAGLVTTARTGRSVEHHRTPLADLLLTGGRTGVADRTAAGDGTAAGGSTVAGDGRS
ncbi:helix-turn-helix domain-containing protein [Streptomyces sp. NPDC004111]|uniref:helix-turn-helix domain-containing protein n=1 Tax=Streptomyces sp. NPDC004111 TaxID=3364690 RepID=UPI003697D56D